MKSDLTSGSIPDLIKTMAIPASIGLFFQALYNATDEYFAGQLSVTALAGISISFPIYFLILALGSGLGVAANAYISKKRGEKDFEKAKDLAGQAILLSIFLSVVASIIGLTSVEPVFSLIGAKADTLYSAVVYMNAIYYGLVFFFLTMVLNGLLNSIGNMKTFGYVLVFGFFLNIILDPWFMYGWFGFPAMGVAGVAWATVVTQIISTLVLAYQVAKSKIVKFNLMPNIELWTKMAAQAIPVTISHSSVALGFLVITKFVSDFGDNAIATFGIGIRIDQLVVLPAIGIAIAVTSIVGQNFGAKRFDRIVETYKISLKYSAIFLAVAMVLVFIFATSLAAIFTKDSQVIDMTSTYLRLTVVSYFSTAIIIISSSVLQGLIKANLSLVLTILRFFIITIPAIMIFAYFLNLREIGIWIALLVSSILVAVFSYFYVLRTIEKIKLSN